MDNKELLKSKIENYILCALEKEFLEADIRIELADIPVSEEDILLYEGVFSCLDDDDLWIHLHEMNKMHNISDEILFERTIDKIVDKCLASDSKPSSIKKISIYHVKQLSPTKWFDSLKLAQISDPDEKVDDDRWETEIKPKMDEVLRQLDLISKRDNERDYNEASKAVTERFPYLKDDSLKYFISAEVFYKKFVHEDEIDYAPVLIEYCRSVEVALWKYMDATDIYREQWNRANSSRTREKTFGSAVRVVKDAPGGELDNYLEKLTELKEIRNNCAHMFVARIPNARETRKYLWESDLMDTLCKIAH